MRQKPTIINLYDRPLYPRPSYSSRDLKPIEYPRPFLSRLVVTAALLYCAVYLLSGLSSARQPVRPERAPPMLERADVVPILTAPEAPAPDMSSADVRFAAADAHVHPATSPEPAKIVAKAPQKKLHIIAKESLPKEAMPQEEGPDGRQAYAFVADHRTHDGGGF